MLTGLSVYLAGKKRTDMASEEIGSFGYGFKVLHHDDGRIEFQPTTIIKNVPIEFIIMQIEVFLENLKKEYHEIHGRKPSEG